MDNVTNNDCISKYEVLKRAVFNALGLSYLGDDFIIDDKNAVLAVLKVLEPVEYADIFKRLSDEKAKKDKGE